MEGADRIHDNAMSSMDKAYGEKSALYEDPNLVSRVAELESMIASFRIVGDGNINVQGDITNGFSISINELPE